MAVGQSAEEGLDPLDKADHWITEGVIAAVISAQIKNKILRLLLGNLDKSRLDEFQELVINE